MPNSPAIVLASTSVHRQTLLARLGLAFESLSPGIAESDQPGEAPAARARRLALAKATSVAVMRRLAIVIGRDQVASIEGTVPTRLLHKPGDVATARAQLAAMSGHVVRFDTAVAVVRGNDVQQHVDITRVQFRPLTDAEISAYVEREPALDCAGGFKCEGLGVSLFESVETRDPTALIGLPLIAVCAALRRLGVAA
jgi:septum formation protein